MLSPAAPLGAALNGAVAGTKTGMKLLDKLPGKKVLAQRFKEMAEAARDRDWTRFEAISRNTLPFMQLFAAVALDEDLRNLLGSAIRNTADLDNWAKYLKGYADQPDTVAHVSPLPKGLFAEAYAAKSPFKKILEEYSAFARNRNITHPGETLSETIAIFNAVAIRGGEVANSIYRTTAIKAITNVAELGGNSLVETLSKFNSGRLHREVEDFMQDLSDIRLDDLPAQAKQGFQTVLKEMSHNLDNKAKGAVHHINVLAEYQRQGLDIIKIELRETVTIAGQALRDRQYDVIVDINGVLTKIEAKSWVKDGIEANTKHHLLGEGVKNASGIKVYNDKGAQLLMDLMSYSQKSFTGHKWIFHKDMIGSEEIFKSVVFKNLRENSELRDRLLIHLKKDDDQLDDWIDALETKIPDFFEVIK